MFIVAIILPTRQLPLKEIKYLGPNSVCPSNSKTQFTVPLAKKNPSLKNAKYKDQSVVFTSPGRYITLI
jgi:hypothetical protein